MLYIQGDVECRTWWQMAAEVYLFAFVGPVLLVLAAGPFFVQRKEMSVRMFLFSCLLPAPTLLWLTYNHIRYLVHNLKNKRQEEQKHLNFTESEEIVFHILLRHYRPLCVCGFSFTWLGIQKLHRMVLVACYTYIKEPLPRLSAMVVLVIGTGLATVLIKSYKDNRANKTACLSHIASICIAIINMCKCLVIASNYKPTSLSMVITLQYFDVCEAFLLTWLPVVAIGIWLLFSVGSRLQPRLKVQFEKLARENNS